MTATATAICADCSASLPMNEDPPSPCPACGSVRRRLRLELMDHMRVYDGIVGESVDRHGEVVAESIAFETKQAAPEPT